MFLSTLYFAFNAVMPILLLMLLGYFAMQKGILKKEFIKPANAFTFRFGISALMYVNLYKIETLSDIPLNLMAFVMIALVLLTLVGFLAATFGTGVVSRKGVLMQAAFRSNYAIIGIPLAAALAGEQGSILASAMQAATIIFYNFTSVLALSIYSDQEGSFNLKKVGKSIATNPLIIALILGLITLGLRSFIPVNADGSLVFSLSENLPWFYKVLTYLSNMATPLALVILGAQFDFTSIAARRRELVTGILLRIVAAPILGFAMAFVASRAGLITINPATIGVLVALFGSPLAVSSVVMSSEMGADDILCGQIVVWSSLFSMATIFLQVVLFRTIGLI